MRVTKAEHQQLRGEVTRPTPLFYVGQSLHGHPMEWTDAENRLARVKASTDTVWLDQVRRAEDVQKTVRLAADRRLRKLTKVTRRREDAKGLSVEARGLLRTAIKVLDRRGDSVAAEEVRATLSQETV